MTEFQKIYICIFSQDVRSQWLQAALHFFFFPFSEVDLFDFNPLIVTVFHTLPLGPLRIYFLGDGDAGGCGEKSDAGRHSAEQEVQRNRGLHPAQLQDGGGAGEHPSPS